MPRLSIILFLSLFMSPLFTQDYTVNGYTISSNSINFNKGLRLKGFGDYLFNNQSYAQAVPYYQKALRLIPTEADAAFQLGRIYHYEKLYRLSELYYQQSIDLFQKSENYDKTQLKAYMARVHIAELYHEQNMKEKTIATLTELRKEDGLLKTLYTPAWKQLESNLGKIYPAEATMIRGNTNIRPRTSMGQKKMKQDSLPDTRPPHANEAVNP